MALEKRNEVVEIRCVSSEAVSNANAQEVAKQFLQFITYNSESHDGLGQMACKLKTNF
jgi:hypothetical protein